MSDFNALKFVADNAGLNIFKALEKAYEQGKEDAAKEALEGNDTNVPTNSALDHIYNVVAEREYQRGYKTAKEEYDHKLTEIKSRFKDHYYNKGYEQGKADANHPEIPDSWVPVSEKMPESADCPMDCLVTRKSKTIGNYTDMAVAEKGGTWTHEDWEAIVLGDNVSGKKTGLLNTRGDEIVAWMPLPEPWKGEAE